MPRCRPTCRIFILGVLFLLAVSTWGESSAFEHENPIAASLPVDPGLNIIVISFDALRVDALGVYGNTQPVSARIDDFAAGGLVFDQAYSAAQSTPTSFAAAFTGKYPFEVFLGWSLADSVTLAGTLGEAGYRTAGFFNNRQLDTERKFNQGFDTYEVVYEPDEEIFLEQPLRWLEDNRDERLFLWVHFISPHAPYDYREMAADFYDPGYEGIFATGSGPTEDLGNDVSGDELARLKELYAGEVFYADFLFGRMMDSLQDLGLLEKSLVVVTADHGEELMDHGVLFHDQVYEEIIRVPLIMRHPASTGGERTSQQVSNIDLFPTFAALVGVEAPNDLRGRNLLESPFPDRPLVSTSMTISEYRSMGLRSGDFKLIATCRRQNKNEYELYDLADDPGELTDLAATYPDVTDSLATILQGITVFGPCKAISRAVRGASPMQNLDRKKIKQLKSLGYVR